MKTPASVSGRSTGVAKTERPFVVHSGINRAKKGTKSSGEKSIAADMGSRAKLSLKMRTIRSLNSGVATIYWKSPSLANTRDLEPEVNCGTAPTVRRDRSRHKGRFDAFIPWVIGPFAPSIIGYVWHHPPMNHRHAVALAPVDWRLIAAPTSLRCKRPRATSSATAGPRMIVLISESEGAPFLEDAAELWRRREAHSSIRVQEGEPRSPRIVGNGRAGRIRRPTTRACRHSGHYLWIKERLSQSSKRVSPRRAL